MAARVSFRCQVVQASIQHPALQASYFSLPETGAPAAALSQDLSTRDGRSLSLLPFIKATHFRVTLQPVTAHKNPVDTPQNPASNPWWHGLPPPVWARIGSRDCQTQPDHKPELPKLPPLEELPSCPRCHGCHPRVPFKTGPLSQVPCLWTPDC